MSARRLSIVTKRTLSGPRFGVSAEAAGFVAASGTDGLGEGDVPRLGAAWTGVGVPGGEGGPGGEGVAVGGEHAPVEDRSTKTASKDQVRGMGRGFV
jgi:hypothetical protein